MNPAERAARVAEIEERPTAEPIEVVIKGSEKVIGYACPVCHMFCSPLIYACKWELALEAAFDHAKRCCDKHCEDCDVKLEKGDYNVLCRACRLKRDAAKEAARFEKATKIPEAEYDGWVFDESSEEYYASVDEWRDQRDRFDQTYLWATTEIDGFRLDAEDIVGNALENGEHHEDAIESVEDLDDLQEFLDAWCAKQAVMSYMVDYTRAIVLAPEPGDANAEG